MGYYTNYELEVRVHEDQQYTDPLTALHHVTAIDALRKGDYGAEFAINSDGSSCDEVTWYEHEKELAEFSTKYLGVLFVLRGQGENREDMWTKYFYEGKMHKAPAKITYDDFDEHQLEVVT